MIYDYTDKLYKPYVKSLVRSFNLLNRELQAVKFDELNALSGYQTVSDKVKPVYEKAHEDLIEILILMALHSFGEATKGKIVGKKVEYFIGQEDGFRVNRVFDAEKFINDYLYAPEPLTGYIFEYEYERKIQRTIEEIISASGKSGMKKAIDKALRYWNLQAKQSGDNVTMDAFIEGCILAGVKRVMWITQKDDRVCEECRKRDGKIFQIDKIKLPLHYNCRCYFKILK